MRIEEELKLDYSDVLFRPKRSTLKSRKDVNLLRTYRFKYSKNEWSGIPIMAANMDGVGELSVAEKLNEYSKLLFQGTLKHSYPHSWRSKAPLIYRNTPQWFISMEKKGLRDIALKSIDQTIFYPSQGKTRLRSMIETRPDWCVSRQRVWGVPLPLFIDKKTGQPLRDEKIINRIADIYEKEGSNTWFTEDPQRFLGEAYSSNDYEQVKDVVEVWFDSGSTHAFCLEQRSDLKWPASMYLEGSD